jgi:hypothetical protein
MVATAAALITVAALSPPAQRSVSQPALLVRPTRIMHRRPIADITPIHPADWSTVTPAAFSSPRSYGRQEIREETECQNRKTKIK